ncbi:hypothetical protein N7452_008097 [Penicillium brevicompactum]|uniref:Uncharacterized protein n=1 Tax=Penicillium brevicompactum TaxID=5074 RepID=A0A9W9U8R7_PENBR|nr:hypothetical protein N7452_008097 [Penicillium brevicompactum]
MSVQVEFNEGKYSLDQIYRNQLEAWVNANPSTTDIYDTPIHFDHAFVLNGLHVTTSWMDPNEEPHATVKMTNDELRAQNTHYTLHWRRSGDSKYLPFTVDKFGEIEEERKSRLATQKALFRLGRIKKDPKEDYDEAAAFAEAAVYVLAQDAKKLNRPHTDAAGFTTLPPNPRVQLVTIRKNITVSERNVLRDPLPLPHALTKPHSCRMEKPKNYFGLLSTIEEELSPA